MSWLESWLNRRQVRRFDRVHVRELLTRDLERQGRYAELAEELGSIAGEYARLTRVVDYHTAVISSRIRRCEALVRAGQRERGEAEAAQLARLLTEIEGPDGQTLRRLRERMAVAARETGDG